MYILVFDGPVCVLVFPVDFLFVYDTSAPLYTLISCIDLLNCRLICQC